jgi:hypothetical protein
MGLMNEYIKRKWNIPQFQDELTRLIKKYNELRKSYLLVFVSSTERPIPERQLSYEDYYVIHDLLKNRGNKSLDIYLETLGGLGEVAEEIVKFVHDKFECVSFIIAGQAKSAGTIMALSGDEIYMTETASLGPIDAQMKLGRSIISSYDYIEWVEDKKNQAQQNGRLNPVDAIIISQITPGEYGGVFHQNNYAQDLVKEWLVKYKFKNWNRTESSNKEVTSEMKQRRAEEIAREFTNRSRWRTHGRSIKIQDVRDIGLKIHRIEDNPEIAEIVFRIQTVCRFILDMGDNFKIYITEDDRIFRQARSKMPPNAQVIPMVPGKMAMGPGDALEFNHKCQKCGQAHLFYINLKKDPGIDADMQSRGRKPFPDGKEFACICGNRIDTQPIKNNIAKRTGVTV